MCEDAKLILEALDERHPGLTEGVALYLAEAAYVCLARYHQTPVEFSVERVPQTFKRTVDFLSPNERTQNAHANDTDATEAGAYGMSLAAVESVLGMVAVGRAETLTGADWYIAPTGEKVEDFENCTRLEVSGVGGGSSADVTHRLLTKIMQTRHGQSNLPAIAAVVGFRVRQISISSVQGRA